MASVTRFLERKLKLVVNQTKSKVASTNEITFLGFAFKGASILTLIPSALISFGRLTMTQSFLKIFREKLNSCSENQNSHVEIMQEKLL